MILPRRDDKRRDAAPNQRQAENLGGVRLDGCDARRAVEVLKKLEDRKAKPDQCGTRSHPRHQRALKTHARTHPRKVGFDFGLDFKPLGTRRRVMIHHATFPRPPSSRAPPRSMLCLPGPPRTTSRREIG